MSPRLPILLTLCATAAAAAAFPAAAAGPPLPLPALVVPDTAQDRVQQRMAIQQAQAQARLAASQAKIQATLDASQARLEGQVAAAEQAQLAAARQGIAPPSPLPAPPLPMAWPTQEGFAGPIGRMELTALTPQLGRYFGTDRGILVVRAPAHGVLRLQDGDVILSIGGRVPQSSSQAIRILTSYDPGQKIRLVILRQHHKIDMTATMRAPAAGP